MASTQTQKTISTTSSSATSDKVKGHLAIGQFVFSVAGDTPIQSFERVTQGAYAPVALMENARSDYVGRPLESIHIHAQWLRTLANDHVDDLRQMIDTPQKVSTGTGKDLKMWTIKQLTEGKTHLIHNGRAMVTDVQLTLQEYRS